jgi:hypothetical protein
MRSILLSFDGHLLPQLIFDLQKDRRQIYKVSIPLQAYRESDFEVPWN